MSKKHIFYALVVMIVAGISALSGVLAGGLAVYTAVSNQEPKTVFIETTPSTPLETSYQTMHIDIDTAITQAVEKVGPAVVTVVGMVPGQNTFFGRTPDSPVSGSGFVISRDGYIMTNNHVIEDTISVSIIFADGTERPAQIVGGDVFSDIAILKVDGEVPAVSSLGNSDDLKPGESVIAIGSPLGDFKNTVTAGVVSATERMLEVNNGRTHPN